MWRKIIDNLKSEKISLYRDEIEERNYKSFRGFSFVGCIISLIVMLLGFVLYDFVTFNTEFLIIFCYFIIMLLVGKFVIKRRPKLILPIFYTALTPLMIMGVLMGTFLDPTQPAITIMVFICVLPLFILDKPIHIFSFITGISALFFICCFYSKSHLMFLADLVDLVIFYCLAIGVNYFILKDRIDSVENYDMYKNKSEIDPLTALYNRGTGVEKIESAVLLKTPGVFLMIDIDDFKGINDYYGHTIGDMVLSTVGEKLKNCTRSYDIVLRMGGDEFSVFAPGITEFEDSKAFVEKICSNLGTVTLPGDDLITVGFSVGCALNSTGDICFEEMYRIGDESLYKAKREGKNRYSITLCK